MEMLSNCCHSKYKIEYWGGSTSRRCTKCLKRCTPISSDDIVEEEEEPEIIPEPTAIEVTL